MSDVLTPEEEAAQSNTALALRSPGVPTSSNELAALKGGAVEIVEARAQVLATLRTASIRATSPEDWLLFKSPEEHGGQITGYLQDCGCDRVRDLYGISIFNVQTPEKVTGAEPGVFHYIVRGDGRCAITRQIIESIEGGRSSTDDFCKDKTGVALDLAVRKAARANLDGNVVRELAGLASVPIAEIEAAWTGTHKKTERCRLGRGFGSRSERLGATREGEPTIEPPMCPHCNQPGQYRAGKGNRGPFYGCKNWDKQGHPKWTQDAAEWIAKRQVQPSAGTTSNEAPSAAKASAKPQPTKPGPTTTQPLTSGDIFGHADREPGEDG